MNKVLERILYIEDENDIRQVARLALELVGKFNVTACGSGEEALAVFGNQHFDLVLLDVMLPEMDGTEILRSLRSAPGGENLPAVFMTAKVQPHEIATLKDLGALDVIPKPFDPMKLPETIRSIWTESMS